MARQRNEVAAARTPSEIAGELRDVNERLVLSSIRAQESFEVAHQERARLRALLETLHEGVAIVDGADAVVTLNQAARRITGLGPQLALPDSVGAIDFRRLDMTLLPRAEHPLARAGRGESFLESELVLVLGNGEVRRIMAGCTTTMDGGRAALSVVVFRDITGRRELEGRLAQTERLAAIGTLAAGVAHEVNNPLAVVMTNIDLVLEGLRSLPSMEPADRADIQSMLTDARDGAERIRTIVSSLGTFAKRADERPSTLDVRVVLETAIGLASNEIRHRARLERAYGSVPLVEVDAAHLASVFVNLLLNAAHAFPETGGARNEIRVVTSTDASGRAVIEICDTGPGIPAEVLSRVFDPFFTTKDVGEGAGLGLSICRNIVLAMGGEIRVESQLGHGTTSRVVLPPRARSLEPAPPAAAEAPQLRTGSVLVVDDDVAIAIVLARLLNEHDVTVATSVEEALRIIETGTVFDVILSDLMMPERSGMDFYEALARVAPVLVPRVVFVSGGAFTPAAAEFLERVPNPCVRKPFEAEQLRGLVRRILDASKRRP
jgi:two-component system cell cycle sensor histidine kinase/response regulator CckA